MRSQFILTTVLCAVTPLAFAQEAAKAPETTTAKVSYAIGSRIGTGLKRDGVEIDSKELLAGIVDGYAGGALKMTEEQMMQVMTEFQQQMQAKMQVESAAAGQKNMEEGKAFLEANGKKEGVVTTASGLQYQILTKGDGPKPKLENKISAHYHGTLTDGTVFDSSIERGEPASFPVQGVIPGWTEALGSKWRLFVPSALAYGERGAGADIGPNATLIFDVELLKIEE
jgi:FKBP-type peptidyl-prolyl cis-trans isomerase FklB